MTQSTDDSSRYLLRLFNPGEFVCMATDNKGTLVTSLAEALATSPPGNFISLNPLDGAVDRMPVREFHAADRPRRADANVTAHRNLLIEFDGMSLADQSQKLIDLEVPYTTLVYSGGKSLHAVIALTESVSRSEYDELFRYLKYVLWQCDPSCRNPSRLTRVAGADREGVTQDLVDIRKRVSRERLVKWLSRFGRHIELCERRELEASLNRRSTGEGDQATVSDQTLAFLAGDVGTKGSRHSRLVAAAFELQEAGKEFDEVLSLIEQAADLHGVTADPVRAGEGAQIVNYVFSRRRK